MVAPPGILENTWRKRLDLCYFERIHEEAPYKTVIVQPLTFHVVIHRSDAS